jgi:branched-chain amino acid transport system ATP-binding protein
LASSLTIENVDAAYGAVRVLEEVTVDAKPGETVVLLGTNGNGKSTLMKCIMGIVRPRSGRITADIDGVRHDLTSLSTEQIVDLGIALVPEGRRLFPKLTVEENLLLGAFRPQARQDIRKNLEFAIEVFPILGERRRQPGGTLSGGEQQMLAIGRALMARPKLLLLDEPSLGLAPMIVTRIFEVIRELNQGGSTILLVEQNARMALKAAHRGYVLETGTISMSGSADKLITDPRVRAAYLGEGEPA